MAKLSINQKRLYVMEAYPGFYWHRKVSMMSPEQICAVYASIKEREKRARKTLRDNPQVIDKVEPMYHQIDIWEYMCIKKGGMQK